MLTEEKLPVLKRKLLQILVQLINGLTLSKVTVHSFACD